MKFSLLASLSALAAVADARISWGSCPTGQTYATMDQAAQEKFAGTWYEIQRDKWFPMEIGAECVTQEYAMRPDGNMNLWFRGDYTFLGYRNRGSGVGGQLQDCKDGSPSTFTCKATMTNGKSSKESKQADLNFLAVDDRWAIMYNCFDKGWMHADYITVLARDTSLSVKEMVKIRSIVKA